MSDDNTWRSRPLVVTRKPAEVECMKLSDMTLSEVAIWCGGEVVREPETPTKPMLNVPTVNGGIPAYHRDWVVKTEYGRFEVYNQEEFKKRFSVKDPRKALPDSPTD